MYSLYVQSLWHCALHMCFMLCGLDMVHTHWHDMLTHRALQYNVDVGAERNCVSASECECTQALICVYLRSVSVCFS